MRNLLASLSLLTLSLAPGAQAGMEDVLFAEGTVTEAGRVASPAIGDQCSLIVWDREHGGKTADLHVNAPGGSYGASHIHLKEWTPDFGVGKAEGHLMSGVEGDFIGYKIRTFAEWDVKAGFAVYREKKTRLGFPAPSASFTCKIERYEFRPLHR